MATKRQRRTRERSGITPAALEAWHIGDSHELNRLLDVRPWQVSPFDVTNGPAPPWSQGTLWGDSWPRAVELRRQLIELAGPPGLMDRHGNRWGCGTK